MSVIFGDFGENRENNRGGKRKGNEKGKCQIWKNFGEI